MRSARKRNPIAKAVKGMSTKVVPDKRRKKKEDTEQRMSFKEACDLVDDDLPDGAYWAMAHEMAGLDYGDGFDELIDDDEFPDEGD